MGDIYFYVGMLLALARFGYRYAVDFPKAQAIRTDRDSDWKIGFFFWTLGEGVALTFGWIAVLIAYGFYRLFQRFAKKD